jgi:hypothetical protein
MFAGAVQEPVRWAATAAVLGNRWQQQLGASVLSGYCHHRKATISLFVVVAMQAA